MKDLGVQQIIVDGRDSQPSKQRLEFAGKYESNLVGMEENVKTLLGYLVERDDVQVVSITGMGGLGKTTLARQAFHHDKVKRKFDKLAWVCVSQVCDGMNVWQAILHNLTSKEDENEIRKMTEATLQDKLFRLLETSNSLIVLDDIWKKEDWDMIKPIFPHKAGSKVLLTSRNERVAGHGETYINFKPEYLSDQDSWTLFQSIAMSRKDASDLTPDDDEEMEKMGKKMMEHCRGLPLAIRVLGGLLAEKYTINNWKRLSENIRSHLVGRTSDDNKNSLNHILSLSFEELPGYLKFCFLYLAHFPEDYDIYVVDLSYFWAAEGILRYETGDSIRDVGDNYIEELVRRNMVISEIDKTTGRFVTCRLHDLMRETCLSKAKEENFLHIVGISSPTLHSQSLNTPRRFVSQDLMITSLDVERDINNSKVRSLVVIWNSNSWMSLLVEGIFIRDFLKIWQIDAMEREVKLFWRVSNLGFTRLQLLRVLHLPGAKFKGRRLSNSIGKLVHLRYLSLDGARVSHLPSSLQNLKLLIYLSLDVLGCSHLRTLTFLLGMKELRYLALPRGRRKKRKLELNHLLNLETLINFSTKYCNLEDLRGMARLRTLGIDVTDETSLETLSASIDGLEHLENLVIVYDGVKGTKEWSTLLDFNNLKNLRLMTSIPLLSHELQFPSRLTTLCLSENGLKEDPMPILENLSQLKDVRLWTESFMGRRMVCSRGGFPKLQKLELKGLCEWEEWIVEEGSMPLLHTLSIESCWQLKELPDGMRFITSLEDLSFENMRDELKERLSEGGDDYYKVQHIPSVTFEKLQVR
ncbi:hypothetical protein BRARA_I01662 [Brassica rapa]|uniref:Uncharacterized protein n=1 Tax=Brassica campestris TaxID=3711 RepID=A0A397XUZ1_BRACM|nr:hypothetical protein BRARA_I01662 [Brassica rapa]